MKITREIRIPRPINFVQTIDGHPVDVADLSHDQLEELAQRMRVELLRNAAERQSRREATVRR